MAGSQRKSACPRYVTSVENPTASPFCPCSDSEQLGQILYAKGDSAYRATPEMVVAPRREACRRIYCCLAIKNILFDSPCRVHADRACNHADQEGRRQAELEVAAEPPAAVATDGHPEKKEQPSHDTPRQNRGMKRTNIT